MEYNFINPIIRDTVNGGKTPGDTVSIRFTTDNPGPWIFHWYVSGVLFLVSCWSDRLLCFPVILTSTSRSNHGFLSFSVHGFDLTLRGLALVFAEAPEDIDGPQDNCPGM